ncbi:hypothetical protein [Chryseobacterium scophthalmum]|uniref:hypothetical protein n=1 Tax=Chryseobacterium scophthalmum TaxID=59733 RepID=UPI001AEBA67D|nr:hypothetical protein [Chryseobacterium scophthalmum]
MIGPGERRIPIINSGTNLDIQFSNSDVRTINILWSTLQPQYGVVDLLSENGAVRIASGTTNLSDITDLMIFRFPSHYAGLTVLKNNEYVEKGFPIGYDNKAFGTSTTFEKLKKTL